MTDPEDPYEEWVLSHGGRETRRPAKPFPTRLRLGTIPAPAEPIEVSLRCDGVTTLDPVTHQPDFIVATITYGPSERLIDSKSLHAYIVDLRDKGFSMERLATVIARDVWNACQPRYVRVTVEEKPRGGVAITATAEAR